MRASTEQNLNRIWYGGERPSLWLRLLVPLYRAGNRIDRWYQAKRRPDDLDNAMIIVVGNLTAGGSGKTPLVVRLCSLLQQAGLRPGVVSRGYGRRDRRLRLVSPASDAADVGDEPLLIARQTGAPVMVSPNRCEAARKLLKTGVNVILSDDGLQHYRLPRKIEICVIDGSRGFGNGLSLPAGPMREPIDRLRSVDFIVVNGGPVDLPTGIAAIPMSIQGSLLTALDGGQAWRLAQFAGCTVNAVAGIGNPDRFFTLLRQARIRVNEFPFPDHHDFQKTDFEGMDENLPILMTGKDAVKCASLGLKNAWSLAVEAVLPPDWEHALVRHVIEESQ